MLVLVGALSSALSACNNSDSSDNPEASDLPLPAGVTVVRAQPSCNISGCGTGLIELVVRAGSGADVCKLVDQELGARGWTSDGHSYTNNDSDDELRATCENGTVTLRRPGRQGWRARQATQDGTRLR